MFYLLWQECKSLHGEYVGRACGHEHPYVPDVLFWSVILFFSTVTLSATLKQFKTSRYFPTKVLRLQFFWSKCEPTESMLWSHVCFRTKERAIAVVKGATKRFLCDWAASLGVGMVREVRESILWYSARSTHSLQAYLLTSNPRDKLPLSHFHFWNSKAHTALLIVTFLPSEQWELFQPDRHLIGATVTFCNWGSPCKTHWNTILFFIFKVSVPPPYPPRLHLHIWKGK